VIPRLVYLSALFALALAPGARLYAPPTPKATAESLLPVEKYLMNDTALLVVVTAKPIKDSAVFAKNVKPELEKLLDHEKFAKYFAAFGVKPIRDLERVVIAAGEEKRRTGNEPREERIQIFWQGKFDEKKVKGAFADLAKEHQELKMVEKDGKTLYQIGRDVFFAILDAKTILMCPSEKLALETLERASGKEKPKFADKDLAAALKTLSETRPVQAFALEKFAFSHDFKNENGQFTMTPITLGEKGVRKFTVTADAKEAVDLKVVIEGKDKNSFAEASKMITDGFDKMKQELDREGQREPIAVVAAKIMKDVKVKTADASVTFEGKVVGEDARAFAEKFFEMIRKELDRAGR